MFIRGAILIFASFLQVIYAQNPIILDKSLSIEAAAEALVEIQPNQALPLVLFEKPQYDTSSILPVRHILQIPTSMVQAVTQNRRMIDGTEFSNFIGNQIFFCPQGNKETCLIPQKFTGSKFLECDKEPIPLTLAESKQIPCGSESTGNTHYIAYNICPKKRPYKYDTSEIRFYEFCYDWKKEVTLYTSHIISSPLLFTTNLLLREREVKYSVTINDEFRPSIFDTIKDTVIPVLDLFIHPQKSAYKLQTLVPDADMAMALWRKTTYQNFNLAWQHEKLIPLWDNINGYVRSYAEQLQAGNRVKIRTGVFDIEPKSNNDVQLSNTWVKIISTITQDNLEISSVVILMNNFIHSVAETSDDLTTHLNQNQTANDNLTRFLNQKEKDDSEISVNKTEKDNATTSLDQTGKHDFTTPLPLHQAKKTTKDLCKDNSCTENLRAEFENVGGRIWCCALTDEILKLFGIRGIKIGASMLQIPGVNFASQRVL